MKNLVLVGFMGSGKTTVGKWVAERLGMTFVDMDHLIEQRQGQTVSHIFRAKGEPFFRQLERSLTRDLAAQQGQVIATGGGIVLNQENIDDFTKTGVVVCLWTEPHVVHERTKRASHRPLVEGDDRPGRIKKLLREREPLYKAIPNQIDTSQMGLEQVVDEVLRIYKRTPARVVGE
jgi:shikimate kinase